MARGPIAFAAVGRCRPRRGVSASILRTSRFLVRCSSCSAALCVDSCWKEEIDRRPSAQRALHFHVAAQILHDGARLISSDSESFLLGCVQRAEESVRYELGAHPDSVILDTNANASVSPHRAEMHGRLSRAGFHFIRHDMFKCGFELFG